LFLLRVDEAADGTANRLQNSRTLVNAPLCYYTKDPTETAGVQPEEGGDDVKSSRPSRPGLHSPDLCRAQSDAKEVRASAQSQESRPPPLRLNAAAGTPT